MCYVGIIFRRWNVMKFGLSLVVVMVVLLAGNAATVSAAMIRVKDQQNTVAASTYGELINSDTWWQTITSAKSGVLNSVEVFFTAQDQIPQPENVRARVIINDIVVGTSVMLYSDVGASSLVFDFSSNAINLPSGTQWMLDITGTDIIENFVLDISTNNPYAGGNLHYSMFNGLVSYEYPEWDMRFIESIDIDSAIPEPSTFILLGAGLGGVALLRRKARA
jgi:hypothetical protein